MFTVCAASPSNHMRPLLEGRSRGKPPGSLRLQQDEAGEGETWNLMQRAYQRVLASI